jgi:hypothetical protein
MTWGPERTWRYLGSSRVTPERRIAIPEDVFEVGVLPHPDEASDEERLAYWGYDDADGTLILSDAPLRNDPPIDGSSRLAPYKSPHTRGINVGRGGDGYRATIPSVFFADSEGGPSVVDERVPDHARVRLGEERHFLTAEEFLGDGRIETNSCYLLTRPELEGTVGGFGEGNEHLPEQPRFR